MLNISLETFYYHVCTWVCLLIISSQYQVFFICKTNTEQRSIAVFHLMKSWCYIQCIVTGNSVKPHNQTSIVFIYVVISVRLSYF